MPLPMSRFGVIAANVHRKPNLNYDKKNNED